MSENTFSQTNQIPNNSQYDENVNGNIERLNALAGFNQDEPAENTLTINFDDGEDDEFLVPPGEQDSEAPVSRMSFMPQSLNKVGIGLAVLFIIIGVGWHTLSNSQENEGQTENESEQIEGENDLFSGSDSDILSENRNGEELGKLKAEIAMKEQEKELEKINQQAQSSSQKQKSSTTSVKQPTPKTTATSNRVSSPPPPTPRKVQTPPPPSPPPQVAVRRVPRPRPRPTPKPTPVPTPTVTPVDSTSNPKVDPETAWLTASTVGSFGGNAKQNNNSTVSQPIQDGPYDPIYSGTDDPAVMAALANQQSDPQPYQEANYGVSSPPNQRGYEQTYQTANQTQYPSTSRPTKQTTQTPVAFAPMVDPSLEAPVLTGVKREVGVIPPNTRIQGVLREAIAWDDPSLVHQAPVLIQLSEGITDEEGKQIIPPEAEVTAMVQQARPSGLVMLTVTNIDFPTATGYQSIPIPPGAIAIKQVSGMPLIAQKIQPEGQQPGVDTGGVVLDVLGATLPILSGGSSGNPYQDMYRINQIQQLYGKYRQQQPQYFSRTASTIIWHLQQDTEVELIIRQPIRIFQQN